MIKVNSNLFRIAYTCVSTEETRYYLRGVYVAPNAGGGVDLVSTDGHRLLVVHDAEGICDSPAIVQLTKDALKLCKPSNNYSERRISFGDAAPGSVIALVTERPIRDKNDADWGFVGTSPATFIDGTFPDYRRIVPREIKTGAHPVFDGRYLEAFGKISADFQAKPTRPGGRDTNVQIRVFSEDMEAPAVVLFPGVAAFGLLIPVRTTHGCETFPEFWGRSAPTQKAEAAE